MDIEVINDLKARYENQMILPRDEMMELFAFAEATASAPVEKPKRATKAVVEVPV